MILNIYMNYNYLHIYRAMKNNFYSFKLLIFIVLSELINKIFLNK